MSTATDAKTVKAALAIIHALPTLLIVEYLRPDSLKDVTITGGRAGFLDFGGPTKWSAYLSVKNVPDTYKGTVDADGDNFEIQTYLHGVGLNEIVSYLQKTYGDDFVKVVFLEALD